MSTSTHFIVKSATAHMPNGVKAPYRRVAVLEVAEGVNDVKMISVRARGVVRVVKTWERCHAGAAKVSAFDRAMAQARVMAADLNATR